MPSPKKNLNAYRGVLKNKNLAKILRGGLDAPIGSTKRKQAQKIFSILGKLQDDGQGGPGPAMPQVNPQLQPRMQDYTRTMFLPATPKVRVPIGSKAPASAPWSDGAGYSPMDGAGYAPMDGAGFPGPMFGNNSAMQGAFAGQSIDSFARNVNPGASLVTGPGAGAAGSPNSGGGNSRLTVGAGTTAWDLNRPANRFMEGTSIDQLTSRMSPLTAGPDMQWAAGAGMNGLSVQGKGTPQTGNPNNFNIPGTTNPAPNSSKLANPGMMSAFGTQIGGAKPAGTPVSQFGGVDHNGDGKINFADFSIGLSRGVAGGSGPVQGPNFMPTTPSGDQATGGSDWTTISPGAAAGNLAERFPGLVQGAVDASMGSTAFAISAMQQGADYLNQLPGMQGFSDETLGGGSSLAQRLEESKAALKKSFQLDEMLNRHNDLLAGGATIQGDLTDYIRGRDEFLNETNGLISKLKNTSLTADMSNPTTRHNMNNHMNYLYEMRGRQNKRYIEYLNTSVDMYKVKVLSSENMFKERSAAFETALAADTAITTEQYNQMFASLVGMYDEVKQAPLYQAQISQAGAASLQAWTVLGNDAISGGQDPQTAAEIHKDMKSMNYIDADGGWVNNNNAFFMMSQNAQRFIPFMQDALQISLERKDKDGNLMSNADMQRSVGNVLGHLDAAYADGSIESNYYSKVKGEVMSLAGTALGNGKLLPAEKMPNVREALLSLKPKTPLFWRNTPTPSKEDFIGQWSGGANSIDSTILGFVYDQMKRDVDSDEGMTVADWVQSYVVEARGPLGQNTGQLNNDASLRNQILGDYVQSFTATSIAPAQGQQGQQQATGSVVSIAESIKFMESKGDYNARGADGEFGAYQFMEATWKDNAGQILGNPNAQPTPANQDAVAQGMVSKWSNQGFNPNQIFAMWNAGPNRPDAWDPNKIWTINGQQTQGWRGVNANGNRYDTVAYARGAMNHMNSLG